MRTESRAALARSCLLGLLVSAAVLACSACTSSGDGGVLVASAVPEYPRATLSWDVTDPEHWVFAQGDLIFDSRNGSRPEVHTVIFDPPERLAVVYALCFPRAQVQIATLRIDGHEGDFEMPCDGVMQSYVLASDEENSMEQMTFTVSGEGRWGLAFGRVTERVTFLDESDPAAEDSAAEIEETP